jgi:hypothetical protein
MEDMYKNEILCDGCKCSWDMHKRMYETAWSDVHWCGKSACAFKILNKECTKLKKTDCKL